MPGLMSPHFDGLPDGAKSARDLHMLTNTFVHIQGIGAITEKRLWESGIRNWGSVSGDLPIPVSGARRHFLLNGIEESRRHLDDGNPAYFSKLPHRIKPGESSRSSEILQPIWTSKPRAWTVSAMPLPPLLFMMAR